MACHERKSNGGYGVAVALQLVELFVWVQLPVATLEILNITMVVLRVK